MKSKANLSDWDIDKDLRKTSKDTILDKSKKLTIKIQPKNIAPKTFNRVAALKATKGNINYGMAFEEALISDRAMLVFLKNVWKVENHRLFEAQGSKGLTLPTIKFLRNTSKVKKLAHWLASANEIAFSRKVFNAGEKVIIETMIHEMCHQAVTKLSRTREADAHGPIWRNWMLMCGQSPDATYKGSMNEFLDPKKKEKQEKWQQAVVQVSKTLSKINDPKEGMACAFVENDGEIVNGFICCRASDRWAILLSPMAPLRWRLVPTNLLYEVSGEEALIVTTRNFKIAADKVRTAYGLSKLFT